MATYDLTSKDTTGVESDVIAAYPSAKNTNVVKTLETYVDFDALIAGGLTFADGDILQALEIQAGSLVLNAGVEVMKVTNSGVTIDVDFAAGDDIIDGGDTTSAGYLAKGTNGQTNIIGTGSAPTYTQFIGTTDTIDVKLVAAATTGRIRVYATIIDCNGHGLLDKPDEVDRDQLA